MVVHLIISLRGNEPATHGMLQNQQRIQKTYQTKCKFAIKDDYLKF